MTAKFEWNDELVDRLCEEISGGGAIYKLAGTDGFPSEPTIYRDMARDPDFAARIAEARRAQQDYEADACVTMADQATAEDWQVVKLRIWARQWRASKLAPKKFGDSTTLKGDKDAPLYTKGSVSDDILAILTTDQLEQLKNNAIAKNNGG